MPAPVNISWVTVTVADMAAVHSLWVDQFGLKTVAQHQGADPELARLWGIPPEQIASQCVLGTSGADTGLLHFVELSDPDPSVRSGAATTDLGAKNLDINCTDMPALVESLTDAGQTFRSAIAQYEFDGIEVREVQMPVHDDLNVVLIEVLSGGFEVNYSSRGYAALTSFVVIVPDVAKEVSFYQALFGMERILAHQLSGPELEAAAGLPPGTVLDLHLLGEPDNLFGRMELIEYVGVSGTDLFTHARPPATGIMSCGFEVASLDEFLALAKKNSLATEICEPAKLLPGNGAMVRLSSPAGFSIYVRRAA